MGEEKDRELKQEWEKERGVNHDGKRKHRSWKRAKG